jgi:hypothetical protein
MYLSIDVKVKNKFHVQKPDLAFKVDFIFFRKSNLAAELKLKNYEKKIMYFKPILWGFIIAN